jgi:DNA replication and repair protein RecF
MDFVSGNPERRRWFFDQNKCLYDLIYLEDLRKYKKILKTRNSVLKECKETRNNEKEGILDTIDIQLAEYGKKLIEKRAEEARCFSRIFQELYETVSGIDGISIKYNSSWKEKTESEVIMLMRQRREQEIFFGSTTSGPHRDRYIFMRDGSVFSDTASTGQRRLLALLLRIAQAQRFCEMTGKNPVLLLDDVLLELDGEKRKKFLSVMPAYEQAFYTFLPEEAYQSYKKDDTLIFDVDDGNFTRQTWKKI